MKKKKYAEDFAYELFLRPVMGIPELALKYLENLSKRVGSCGEVGLTAFAVYAQIVEGLECKDSSHKVSDEERNIFESLRKAIAVIG